MLNLDETIDYIDNAILGQKEGFFVNSIIGRLAIEVVFDFDIMNPVNVSYWRDAPSTKWARRNAHRDADIYISIGVTNNEPGMFIRMKSIEAFHRAFFLTSLGIDVSEAVADAATIAYLKHNGNINITRNFIEDEYINLHYNIFTKNDPMVRSTVRKLINMRVAAAENVMDNGKIIIKTSRKINEDVSDYNLDLFILTCHILASVESPAMIDRNRFSMICDKAVARLSAY